MMDEGVISSMNHPDMLTIAKDELDISVGLATVPVEDGLYSESPQPN